MTLIQLLIFLPLLSIIFSGAILIALVTQKHTQTHHICRKISVELQKKQGVLLNKLIRLNPKAKKLRRKAFLAKKALNVALVSGNIPVIATAKAAYLFIKGLQIQLRAEQQSLLTEAKINSKNVLRKIQRILNHYKIQFHQLRYHQNGLAVFAIPITSLTPNYHLVPFFKSNQAVSISFTTQIHPSFIQNLEKKFNISTQYNTRCGATLLNKKGQVSLWKR